jgi:hypothetical protein
MQPPAQVAAAAMAEVFRKSRRESGRTGWLSVALVVLAGAMI